MSARIAIRDAIGAALIDATAAESRVTVSRGGRVGAVELPEIVVWLGDEEVDPDEAFHGGSRHALEVLVEITAAGATGAAAELLVNQMHDAARTAIAEINLSATIVLTAVTQTRLEASDQGSLAIMRLSAQYQATYFTTNAAPAVLL